MRSPTSARSKRVWDLHTGRELEELGHPPLTRTPPCPTAPTWAVCPALPGRGGGESVVALWSRPERGEVQGRGPSCPREEQEATCPGPQDTPGQG